MSAMDRVCLVCGIFQETGSKTDPKVHVHYGAMSCMSCKAFFRRCVRDKAPTICKQQGHCNITSKSRIKCKKCRYERCLAIGMKPELVLTDEADRKKYSRFSTRGPSGQEQDPGLEEDPSGIASTVNDIDDDEPVLDDSTLCESIRQTYIMAWASVRLDPGIVHSVTRFHMDPTNQKLEPSCMPDLLKAYQCQFQEFAKKVTGFQDLHPGDQQILIQANQNLVPHYCLARHLTSTNGWDQLSWILGPETPSLGIDEVDNLQVVTLGQLTIQTGLFANVPINAHVAYLNYCKLIERHFHYPQFHNGILLNVMLYNLQSIGEEVRANLKNVAKITSKFARAKDLFKFGCEEVKNDLGVLKIDQLMNTLNIMNRLMLSSVNGNGEEENNGGELSLINQCLILSYDMEEELWLQDRFALIDKALFSVSPGPDLIQLMIQEKKHSFQSPVDYLGFVQLRVGLVHGRLISLLKLHPEMAGMTFQEEQQLMEANFPKAVFFFGARNMTAGSFEDQVKHVLGYEGAYDKDNIAGDLLDQVPDLAPVLENSNNAPMPVKDKMRFMYLMASIAPFTRDRFCFWLLMLVIIMDQPGSGSTNHQLKAVQQTYKHVFQRRANLMVTQGGNPEDAFNNVMSNIQEAISILAKNGLMSFIVKVDIQQLLNSMTQ